VAILHSLPGRWQRDIQPSVAPAIFSPKTPRTACLSSLTDIEKGENKRLMALVRPLLLALAALYPLRVLAAPPPPRMLWVWERRSDLRDLPPSVGVAFLGATVLLRDGEVRTVPRFQPLLLSPSVFRMMVIRIEPARAATPLTVTQRSKAVVAIADALRITRADAVQVDFDARVSEQPFYKALLEELRDKMGPDRFLSITALVSWCGANSWLDGLPVDEVVPMTFEMGAAAAATETFIRSGGDFKEPKCAGSIGISTHELDGRFRKRQRTYVFSYEGWTDSSVSGALAKLP
jgi:hypothetical protein